MRAAGVQGTLRGPGLVEEARVGLAHDEQDGDGKTGDYDDDDGGGLPDLSVDDKLKGDKD